MGEARGSIGYFTTHRPPVPVDVYSCSIPPSSKADELHMTDGISYNYNAHAIPSQALKTILRRPKLAAEATPEDVDSGRVSGLIMVSERTHGLETLHIVLRFDDGPAPKVKVFGFAEVYGSFDGVRMEDSGCFAGDYLVYVSTKEPNRNRRQPWTAVYKTSLKTGKTERLTPKDEADLNPAVSPSGKRVAVASFELKPLWNGESEDLKTDIFVMNVEGKLGRKLAVRNGGWPTWATDDVLFFHRKEGGSWGIFRADISKGRAEVTTRVTPAGIDAVTPVALSATTFAAATIRQKTEFDDARVEAQFRHIEIFTAAVETDNPIQVVQDPVRITQKTRPKADHYNPFVIKDKDGVATRIGYHRAKSDLLNNGDIKRESNKILSPNQDVGVFRVSGAFPTFSKDGSQLAFVDNEFKSVWLADSKGLRVVYKTEGPDNVFAPVFGQNPEWDVLYICTGPSFHANDNVEISAIFDVSTNSQQVMQLTSGGHNNAFPSTSPDGARLVFRSTRDGGPNKNKNLYILEDALSGEYGEDGRVTRLTQGDWTDTQCQWAPKGELIVFSSNRDKPKDAPGPDGNVDPGYFAVYLVNANDPTALVRVVGSRDAPQHSIEFLAGHINHPYFSPDGKSIVVGADLAGVSVDPISMPFFLNSVRPYGDAFVVDIDPEDITKNKDLKKFTRVTHSRYENSTAAWTVYSGDVNTKWKLVLDEPYTPACPYAYPDGGESRHMTGHLCIPKRSC